MSYTAIMRSNRYLVGNSVKLPKYLLIYLASYLEYFLASLELVNEKEHAFVIMFQ